MGVAPPKERQDQLVQLASATEGVGNVTSLKARYDGTRLHVWMEIRVDGNLSLRDAHDIGEAVERRLLLEADVSTAMVHVDME